MTLGRPGRGQALIELGDSTRALARLTAVRIREVVLDATERGRTRGRQAKAALAST